MYINLTSEIDFNYYQMMQSSLELNLKFLEEVNSISVLCQEREMMKSNKSEVFEYDVCICDRVKMKDQYLFPALSRNENRKNSAMSEMT